MHKIVEAVKKIIDALVMILLGIILFGPLLCMGYGTVSYLIEGDYGTAAMYGVFTALGILFIWLSQRDKKPRELDEQEEKEELRRFEAYVKEIEDMEKGHYGSRSRSRYGTYSRSSYSRGSSGYSRAYTGTPAAGTRAAEYGRILREHPPRAEYQEGDIIVLSVRFSSNGHTYCYKAADNIYKAGDMAEVVVRGERKAVTVESVGYYSPDEYPFTDMQLSSVIGPAANELADRYREALAAEAGDEEERERVREEAKAQLEKAKTERREALDRKLRASELNAESKRIREEADAALREAMQRRDEALRIENAARRNAMTWRRPRLHTNNEIIRDLRGIQDDLEEDEQIYRALSALEARMASVMDKADELAGENNWGSTEGLIRRLHEFYLPKTISVLDQYRNIFSSGLPAHSVEKLRQDVLSAIDKSSEVYGNILTSLYERDIFELSSELEAMQAIFAAEGLLDSDFDIKA